MTQPLIYDREGALAHIRLNRPTVLNAFNQPMADALLESVRAIEADGSVRAVLITGEGRAFMAGGDITLFKGENATQAIDILMRCLHDAIIILARLKVPVISLAHGMVAGAGVSVALAADIVLASDGAKFLLAYSKLGANPDGGSTYQLPRAIGLRRALGFALLEETMDAATAERTGLVNRLLPAAIAWVPAGEAVFLSRTPGSTKLSERTTRTTRPATPAFQELQKRASNANLLGVGGGVARRTAFAFLPFMCFTSLPKDCKQEATNQREQDRQREEIGNTVDVRSDLTRP